MIQKDSLIERKVLDALDKCLKRDCATFVGFLDKFEVSKALNVLKGQGFRNYMLWGGHDSAERLFLGVFPEYFTPDCESFPVVVLYVSIPENVRLSHRDFLGALMSLGIKRECVGDILLEGNIGAFFVKSEISTYIETSLTSVGRANIEFITDKKRQKLPDTVRFDELRLVVSSDRIDCVAAALINKGRSESTRLIGLKSVFVNRQVVYSNSYRVKEKDTVSIRGYGKYTIEGMQDRTKKGKIKLSARKYR